MQWERVLDRMRPRLHALWGHVQLGSGDLLHRFVESERRLLLRQRGRERLILRERQCLQDVVLFQLGLRSGDDLLRRFLPEEGGYLLHWGVEGRRRLLR